MPNPRRHQRAVPTPAPVSDHDLCWGSAAIAQVINRSERQTFWLLENQKLPAQKIGRTWCASRARLLALCVGDKVEPR
jgi:hypothetical protein